MPKKKPPLGQIKLIHQFWDDTRNCIFCGKPMMETGYMETCPRKYRSLSGKYLFYVFSNKEKLPFEIFTTVSRRKISYF